MKLFQTVQADLKFIGFIRNRDGYRYYPFSMRYFSVTFIYLLEIISMFTFAIRSADSAGDYLDSIYILCVSITLFTSFTNNIFKMKKIFDFFDNCEKVCEESKFYFMLFKFGNLIRYMFLIYTLLKKQSEFKYPDQKDKLIKTKQLVELLSKVVHLLAVKMGVPGIIMPKVILSIYKYLTTDPDTQNSVFELPVLA